MEVVLVNTEHVLDLSWAKLSERLRNIIEGDETTGRIHSEPSGTDSRSRVKEDDRLDPLLPSAPSILNRKRELNFY